MQKSDQSAIFNIFHDGTFLSFQRKGDDINFRVEIQYLAEMIDPVYTYFVGSFKNCQQFLLQLWEDEKRCYEDIHLINTILVNTEIANSSVKDNQVFVHCLSEERANAGNTLIFSCDDVTLFDEGQKEITLNELKEIAHRYWQKHQ